MKSFRATWILAVLALALAIYTFVDYRKSQNEGVYADNERPTFTFKPESVTHIRIERPQEVIELDKQADGVWNMTQPVADRGDEAATLAFILSLTQERVRLFNPEDEKIGTVDWAKYGLAPPAVTIEMGSGGKKESLQISTKNAFDGSFYLRKDDELFVGDTGFAQIRDRNANGLRTRLLYREKTAAQDAQVDLEGLRYSVVKKDGQWTLEPKPDFPLDSGKIERWLERVQDLRAGDIVKDGITEDDRKSYLLSKPSMLVQMKPDWSLTIGQDRAEDVFLFTNQRPVLYKISSQALSQIRVPPRYFRDGHRPFEFPIENAREIEVHLPKAGSFVMRKTDKGWSSPDGKDTSEQAVALMQAVHALDAKEYSSSIRSEISSPQIIVKGENGRELFTLAWGADFKAKETYNQGESLVYARTNIEKEILGLQKDKIEALSKIFVPKKEKKK